MIYIACGLGIMLAVLFAVAMCRAAAGKLRS